MNHPGAVSLVGVLVAYFFFSSRSRHTRWPRDWSSDVCSSDLLAQHRPRVFEHAGVAVIEGQGREAAERASGRQAIDELPKGHDVVMPSEPAHLARETFEREVNGGVARCPAVARGQHVMVAEHDAGRPKASHQAGEAQGLKTAVVEKSKHEVCQAHPGASGMPVLEWHRPKMRRWHRFRTGS